jgi:hypothetical protein
MMRWMYATEYLIKDECGYLPTQKLFSELTLKIKREYGDTKLKAGIPALFNIFPR